MKVIESSLRAADDWQAKGQPAWVIKCLSSAIMNFLSLAVEQHDSREPANAWLRQYDAHGLLHRYNGAIHLVLQDIDSQRMPASAVGGTYVYLAYAHLAWALGEFALGEDFVAISARPDIVEISTPFWRLYAQGFKAFVNSAPFCLGAIKTHGQETYWLSYLRLIQRVTENADMADAIKAINEAFAKRNTDKRIKDDYYATEGSGTHPVKWDYRRDGILWYLQNNR